MLAGFALRRSADFAVCAWNHYFSGAVHESVASKLASGDCLKQSLTVSVSPTWKGESNTVRCEDDIIVWACLSRATASSFIYLHSSQFFAVCAHVYDCFLPGDVQIALGVLFECRNSSVLQSNGDVQIALGVLFECRNSSVLQSNCSINDCTYSRC